MSAPLVSICIPTYNRGESLLRAVESALSQSYSNLEIIISDNSSSDETEKICNLLKSEYENIKYYRQEVNIGPTANFEFVRSIASGTYFMWLGDDDWLDQDYVTKCVDHLEKNNDLILVTGTGAYYRSPNTIEFFGNKIQLLYKYRILRLIKYLWLVEENSIFYGIYRTKDVHNCTLDNILAGDWAWICQVALNGKADVVSNTFINRLFGNSDSATYTRLVVAYGFPKCMAKVPLFSAALVVAWNLLSYKCKENRIFQVLYAITAAIVLVGKSIVGVVKSLVSKVPFLRVIYRFIRG